MRSRTWCSAWPKPTSACCWRARRCASRRPRRPRSAMQRDRAQARFDVGRGKITDLQEAQARYDSVLAREVSAQSTLALRQAQYREPTGVPAEGLAALAPASRRCRRSPTACRPGSRGAGPQHPRAGQAGRAGHRRRRDRQVQAQRRGRRWTWWPACSRQGQNGSLSPAVSPDSARGAASACSSTCRSTRAARIDSR